MNSGSAALRIMLLLASGLAGLGQVAETFTFGNLNAPIPDGNASGLSDHQTVNSAIVSLTDVRVKLHVVGEFNGDLYGYVRHVSSGNTNFCVLLNRPGRTLSLPAGYADAGLDVLFDDAAGNGDIHVYQAVTTPPTGSPLSGTWRPDGRNIDPDVVLDTSAVTALLSAFQGANPGGDWTLFLADVKVGATNMLVSWELQLSGWALPPVSHIFYNNSAWDGNSPAANAADDGAIATDKVALSPGGQATFANYTSYSRGINGIMVDLALNAAPTAGDFVFKVGNDNTPSAWPAAPAPTTIAVRTGAGVGGSDRVTIIWADGAIQNQWLQVTVKATVNTGLQSDYVFYFGNAIGDIGDAPAANNRVKVNSDDEIGVRLNPRNLISNPAPVTDPYDFNRDRKVNSDDEIIARLNPENFVNGLLLINPGAGLSSLTGGALSSSVSLASAQSRGMPVQLTARRIGEDVMRVEIIAETEATYQLQVEEELVPGSWSDCAFQPGKDGHGWWWDVPIAPTVSCRFYRVIPLPHQ